MPPLIAASAVRTCFGAGPETFDALLAGACGAGPLRQGDPGRLGVAAAYHVKDLGTDRRFGAGRLLTGCLAEAARQAGLDLAGRRVTALAGTGLGELPAVEGWAQAGEPVSARRLHFGDLVREALPGVTDVITLPGACSAGGHALALAGDMVESGEADAVIVGAADTMTRSMLAMVGKASAAPTRRVRPFDRRRTGVLLGDGAAAQIVVPDSWPGPALARLAGSGLSCDAHHATAPDVAGICRAMRDAYDRASRSPAEADVVVAHGTGTGLNDPAECAALSEVVVSAGGDPVVTAVKGAVGHTSGAAALVNVDVAVRCLAGGVVPPVVGLSEVLEEGAGLRFAVGRPVRMRPALVQSDAFGFGGVNAVTLLAAPP